MPEHTATDNRGQVHFVGETMAVLLIGQARDRQREPTPGQHGHHTLLTQRTDEARERHGGDMVDHGAPLHTEPTMRRQSGVAGHLRAPLAIAEDDVGQDGEPGFAPRTLDTPDGHPTQTDAHLMGVACQASTSVTGRPVCELQANRENAGEDTLEKRLTVFHQAEGGGFVSKIDGDGAVGSCRFGRCAHVSPPGHQGS
jgi:hypothetical protein